MKKGTYYAKKLKSAYGKFRGAAGAKPDSEPTDPVDQLILAVLSQETPMRRAQRALKHIAENMVDYNELRVSSPAEVAASIGSHVPRSIERAKALLQVLNAIYEREYTISLESLKSRGVREMKSYFETLAGITPYVSASVLLWSLGGHAIPVSDFALEFLRKQDLVEPNADAAEVQAFLERHISAADAKAFCLDLETVASSNTKIAAKSAPKTKKTKAASSARKKSANSKTASKKTSSTARKKKTTKTKKKSAKR